MCVCVCQEACIHRLPFSSSYLRSRGQWPPDCRLIVLMLIGYSVRSFLACLSGRVSNASTVSKCAFLSALFPNESRQRRSPFPPLTAAGPVQDRLTSVSCSGARCSVYILFLSLFVFSECIFVRVITQVVLLVTVPSLQPLLSTFRPEERSVGVQRGLEIRRDLSPKGLLQVVESWIWRVLPEMLLAD